MQIFTFDTSLVLKLPYINEMKFFSSCNPKRKRKLHLVSDRWLNYTSNLAQVWIITISISSIPRDCEHNLNKGTEKLFNKAVLTQNTWDHIALFHQIIYHQRKWKLMYSTKNEWVQGQLFLFFFLNTSFSQAGFELFRNSAALAS